MKTVIVIGGGVIGLSIAWELASRNIQVVLMERGQLGRQSSWAGAGILPPVNCQTAIHPIEQLEALSSELHLSWSKRLANETGIENQLLTCGGLYIARTSGDSAALQGLKLLWRERQIEFETWDRPRLQMQVPGLNLDRIHDSAFAPGEWQIRNPSHLQALIAACATRGVQIMGNQLGLQIQVADGNIKSVIANGKRFEADEYCIACGAWSSEVFRPFGIRLPVTPVRGQVVLFKLPKPWQAPIVNEGTRYLVPRQDGHLIAGATIEEVGFRSETEPADIADLIDWANGLLPACSKQNLVKAWAGLRPGSYDGLPYLGRVAANSNTYVATGHFKSGLHLSTGTAVIMADLIEGKLPLIDLAPFSVTRGMIGIG